MASAIHAPRYLSHTSSTSPTISKKPPLFASLSTPQVSYSRNPIFRTLISVPQLGLASFSPWNGLRQNGVSISLKSLRFERRRKCKGKGVFASLFGVGAPEALVIGVVALLVFGPKGLAEIAKNLGKTLRAFQPTIRELQEVSKEFKSTLEKEIGLDELQNPAQGNSTSNIPTLTSSPLFDATPENSQATATETAAAATTKDSQATATPFAATTKDSQATATPPAATTEDSQATATPPAATTEDSQATATPLVATTKDSQATATPPAAAMADSQPTIDPNTVQEVAAGMPPAEKSKSEI